MFHDQFARRSGCSHQFTTLMIGVFMLFCSAFVISAGHSRVPPRNIVGPTDVIAIVCVLVGAFIIGSRNQHTRWLFDYGMIGGAMISIWTVSHNTHFHDYLRKQIRHDNLDSLLIITVLGFHGFTLSLGFGSFLAGKAPVREAFTYDNDQTGKKPADLKTKQPLKQK